MEEWLINRICIELKKEVVLDRDFNETEEPRISVYIHCDSIISWIGYADCEHDVMELIHPDFLRDTLNTTLSEDELEIFDALLHEGTEYYYYDKSFKYTKW